VGVEHELQLDAHVPSLRHDPGMNYWQADDGDRHPWRRRVEFDESARPTPIAPLLDDRPRHGRR
jgi:hypothetical protein